MSTLNILSVFKLRHSTRAPTLKLKKVERFLFGSCRKFFWDHFNVILRSQQAGWLPLHILSTVKKPSYSNVIENFAFKRHILGNICRILSHFSQKIQSKGVLEQFLTIFNFSYAFIHEAEFLVFWGFFEGACYYDVIMTCALKKYLLSYRCVSLWFDVLWIQTYEEIKSTVFCVRKRPVIKYPEWRL